MQYKIFSSNAQIPKEITTRFRTESRAREFYNSRMALKDCLCCQGLNYELGELEISNFHHLKTNPEILVSIAHTKSVGASAICTQNEFKSIGIDIEFLDRTFNENTKKFFLTDLDIGHENFLDLWIKKEASFKALSYLSSDKRFVLTDIWVKNNQFGLVKDQTISGNLTLACENVLNRKLQIVIATI